MEDEEWEDVLVVSFVPLDGRLSYTGDDLDLPYKDLSNIVHPKLTTTIIGKEEPFFNPETQHRISKQEQHLYENLLSRPDKQKIVSNIAKVHCHSDNKLCYAARTADNQVHIMDKNFEILSSTDMEPDGLQALVSWKNHLYCFTGQSILKICLRTISVVKELKSEEETKNTCLTSRVYTSPRGLFYISFGSSLVHLDSEMQANSLAKFAQANDFYLDSRSKDSWVVMQSRGQ